MASSLFVNTVHICFDSVLAMDNQRMVAMFESLVATGLKGFLGFRAVLHEAALLEFFENGSVRDGLVVSTVNGVAVEISEQLLAETFELPVEGLSDLSEISKELVVDARSIISLTGEQVSMSGKKKARKIFDDSRNHLWSAEFPSSNILTEKTVHRYIILNEKFGGEYVTDAPRVKRTPGKKAVSKKRPFVTAAEAEPIVKKKRTTQSKPVSSKDTLVTRPVEAVPLQMIAPTTAAPTEQLPLPKRPTQKRKRRLILGSDDKIVDSEPVVAGVEGKQAETAAGSVTVETIAGSVAKPVSEPAVAEVVNKRPSTTDYVDDIIQQVLTETAQIGADKEEIDGGGETVSGSAVGSQAVDKVDEFEQWLNLSYEEFHARQEDRLVEKASYTEDEMDSDLGNQVFPVVGRTDVVLGTNVVEVRLPSTGVEVTKITLGKSIKIPGVDEITWYMANLPQIPVDDKGKKPLLKKDPVKVREQIIDEVAKFFFSFSLKRLANLKIDDSYYAKEELVLSWAEAESTVVALQRRMYILLKYRELLIRKFLEARKINFASGDGSSTTDHKILDWLSDLHLFVLEELKEQSLVHGLRWDKTCCSKIFEGRNRDPGAVIARSNTNTKSSCWIRTMLRVDGTWDLQVLFNNVHHDMRDHKNLLSLDLTTYQQKVSNQVGAVAFDVVDVRRVVKELDTKVAAVATCLDDVCKDVGATKEAISHQILDFRAQAQENYNILTAQLSELVAYVNPGGNDKKSEDSSSRGPQPPSDDQGMPGEGSASRGSGSGGDGRRRGDSDISSKSRRSGESPPCNIRYGSYPPSGIQKKSAPWWLYGEKEF
ncbi:splicing factor, proline- and glutamine-rich-like [Dorcoceras hygrometricum]|uniref:Splicing factor, proline-and glutamine-rich-like n=1 Tax=Dorcoceras hygrometricum TaxID=472368 RepID=A0A2Z7CQ62_9LAMI|nr:splicing factor, proline- and glutamine-rich-like [Dorcoceras hygrometricum]